MDHLPGPGPHREEVETAVVRFAGDSGDGVQLTGTQFTMATALAGNGLETFPDFPAEIRAPQGTIGGVSAFQLAFADHDITTPGDAPNVLVAMNPAALKANIKDLPRGADLILNTDEFTKRNLEKVGFSSNPIEDGSLDGIQAGDRLPRDERSQARQRAVRRVVRPVLPDARQFGASAVPRHRDDDERLPGA